MTTKDRSGIHTRQRLIEHINAGNTVDYRLFWGHKANHIDAVDQSCLSQWFPSPFEVDGTVYPTAEHWMMAGKAELFGDALMRKAIVDAPTPKAAKALGRKVRAFDDKIWSTNRREIVFKGNVEKFRQHDALRSYLLGTKDEVLVEASPWDGVWGIGMRASDANACDPNRWRGENLLGFTLMQVRDALRHTL